MTKYRYVVEVESSTPRPQALYDHFAREVLLQFPMAKVFEIDNLDRVMPRRQDDPFPGMEVASDRTPIHQIDRPMRDAGDVAVPASRTVNPYDHLKTEWLDGIDPDLLSVRTLSPEEFRTWTDETYGVKIAEDFLGADVDNVEVSAVSPGGFHLRAISRDPASQPISSVLAESRIESFPALVRHRGSAAARVPSAESYLERLRRLRFPGFNMADHRRALRRVWNRWE